MHGYIFTCFWLITLKLDKFVNSRPSFQQCQWIFINKSEMESCKKFVEGPISNFIYGWNFARDISQMKQTRRLFFHILLYFTDVFSPSVCKFIAKRDYENHNSGILAWVTSFTGENTLGLIELNEFVFGANPRVDILHRVVVWQRAKRRAVSKLEYCFTCNSGWIYCKWKSKNLCDIPEISTVQGFLPFTVICPGVSCWKSH